MFCIARQQQTIPCSRPYMYILTQLLSVAQKILGGAPLSQVVSKPVIALYGIWLCYVGLTVDLKIY